jgi:hypothetical protein
VTPPRCIVCGRPIAKRTATLYFREPKAYQPAKPTSWGDEWPAQEAKPDGLREGNHLYLQHRPRTRAEAQRYVNGQIVSSKRRAEFVTSVNYWDGESYADKYFCTNNCAMRQGYASAAHGARYVWRDK